MGKKMNTISGFQNCKCRFGEPQLFHCKFVVSPNLILCLSRCFKSTSSMRVRRAEITACALLRMDLRNSGRRFWKAASKRLCNGIRIKFVCEIPNLNCLE